MGDERLKKSASDKHTTSEEEAARKFVADALRERGEADFVDDEYNRVLVSIYGTRWFVLRLWTHGHRIRKPEFVEGRVELFDRLNALGCFAKARYWKYSHQYTEKVADGLETKVLAQYSDVEAVRANVSTVDAVRANVSTRLRSAGRADYLDPSDNRVLVMRTGDAEYHLQRWIGGYRERNEEVYTDEQHVLNRLVTLGCLNNVERWTLLHQYHEKPSASEKASASATGRQNIGGRAHTRSPWLQPKNIVLVVVTVTLTALFIGLLAILPEGSPSATTRSALPSATALSPRNTALRDLTAAEWRNLSVSDQVFIVENVQEQVPCPVSVLTTVRNVNTAYQVPAADKNSFSQMLTTVMLVEGCKPA